MGGESGTNNGGAGTGGEDAGASGSSVTGSGCLAHDFDLRAALVSGKVTVNGVAISDPASQGVGNLVLFTGTDSALLTTTSSSSYSTLILPGTYDVYFVLYAAGSAMPINQFVKLEGGIVVGTEPLTLDIDVPVVTVSGAVTVNGSVPADVASTGPGSIFFESETSRVTTLSTTASSQYSARVVPGSYDLAYSYPDGSPEPSGTGTQFRHGIAVGSSPVVDIDIPLTPVSVSVTMNGLARTAASTAGTLVLIDAKGGYATLSANSSTSPYSAQVVPGSYDLYWSAPDEPPTDKMLPRNPFAKLKGGIVVGSVPLAFNVDIAVTTISGAITINGSPIQKLGSNLGTLRLQGATGTDPYFRVDAGSYALSLVAGTYDLFYDQGVNGNAPRNSYSMLQSGIVLGSSPLSLDIDIPATLVSGSVTINGKTISAIKQPDFSLWLRSATSTATLLEYPTKDTYSALVIPGTYDLYYRNTVEGRPDIPDNVNAKIQSGIVVGSTPLTLDIDIHFSRFAGTTTVNGLLLPDQGRIAGSLSLKNVDGDAAIVRLYGSNYSSRLLPGVYDTYFYGSGPSQPANVSTYLGCLYVP
jgi:hypothetical protein